MDEKKYMIRTENGYFKIHPAIIRVLNNKLNNHIEEKLCLQFLLTEIKRLHLENIDDFCIASKDQASVLTDDLAQFFNNNNEPVKLNKYSYYYIVEIDGDKEFENRIDN